MYPMWAIELKARSLFTSSCMSASRFPTVIVSTAKTANAIFQSNNAGGKTPKTTRYMAYMPVLMTTPDSMALMGLGAAGCASGSHEWKGAMAALTPKPVTRNAIAT
jgi:hypothetical protein